jgi:uncharacterized protein with ATP-grasp and redox domains
MEVAKAASAMKTSLDCIPCLVRQSLKVARMATEDVAVHEAILREMLHHVSGLDLNRPPLVGQWIYRQVRERTGQIDPYLAAKQESNRVALALYPNWKERISAFDLPLHAALKLAIAANSIDFGINGDFQTGQIPSALETSFASPLNQNPMEFFGALEQAKDILFLADNAGELVFDRLFIELLLPKKITVVVKGGPAINDALLPDAEAAGLIGLVDVIDNGADGAGTLLETCTEAFRQRFTQADLVIAKGQANFESLDGCNKDIFFLLKVKCPVVAKHIGHELGSLVVQRNISTVTASRCDAV